MGSCMSSSELEAYNRELEKRIEELERQLQEAQAKANVLPSKVLLLGSGDSGKTTFLKQMHILYKGPLSSQDTESYRQLLYDNLTWGMKCLIDELKDEGLAVLKENLPHVELIANASQLRGGEPFPRLYYHPLRSLWEDPNVQTTWELSNNVALENLPYLFSSLDRLFGLTYRPTEEDIFRCRVTTIGCYETKFELKNRKIRVVDVGGQWNERKKWFHCFNDVTTVLFFVSLSGYDQCLVEREHHNLMQDAMDLWGPICQSRWFKEIPIVLFLNKSDLFERKVGVSDIRKYFPDYEGELGDVYAGRKYFKRRFVEIASKAGRLDKKGVVIHIITATDTAKLRVVMRAVEE